jgi:putative transposase
MRTVEQEQVATAELGLPPSVQAALGELVNAAKDGLLALSVGVGLGVLSTLMEEEVSEVVGPKGRHDRDRSAVRHGGTGGEVTLGGRRVAVPRPRVRSVDGAEIELQTYAHFADRDPLTRVVLEQMLAGVSTRRFERTREPVGADVQATERSASKSAASRAFVGRTGEHLQALMSRSLADIRLAALMLDGIELKGRCCVVALGVTTDGVKVPLGLWDGSTENKTITVTLLGDLVDRGLDVEQGVLVVLDGAKALRAAVNDVFGPVPVHRCVRHKERNVLDHLPERDRPKVKHQLRTAWAQDDHARALDGLRRLAAPTRPPPSRRRRIAARGPGGDRHAHPVGDHGEPAHNVAVDQRDRVDDQHPAANIAQRQALAERRHVPALDGRRDARSRAAVPQDHRLQRPRQARSRRRA